MNAPKRRKVEVMLSPALQCGECRFAKPAAGELYCHRHPPVLWYDDAGGTITAHPHVVPEGWCGDYEPRFIA